MADDLPFEELCQSADLASLIHAMRRGLSPPPDITVDEWAARYRILDSRTSGEPGPWDNSRTPYLVEIMQRLSPQDPCERVVFKKGSQVGATEIGNNWVGYTIDIDPCPMMVVQSTVDLAKDWSQGRLDPMIELIPRLQERLGPRRARDSTNKIRAKYFPGGALFAVGGNSPAGLRSKPIRKLMIDERSSLPPSAGKEGDPGQLAIRRTATFSNRKIYEVSTPTIEGECAISASFLLGDQRYFEVPCPHCGTVLVLHPEGLVWEPGNALESARYVCESCHKDIREKHKAAMLSEGEWRPTARFDGKVRSYHLSALYSPWFTWAEIADESDKAQRSKDPMLQQTVQNTLYGLEWKDTSGSSIEPHELLALRHDWFRGPDGELGVPAGGGVLTAGVDTQDNRLEVAVYAWGANREAWRVGFFVLYGSPADRGPGCVWDRLDQLRERTWAHETYPPGLRISAMAIDIGGHHATDVYEYCRPRLGYNVWPVKGHPTGDQDVPIWPQRATVVKRVNNALLFVVGQSAAKTWIYHRLAVRPPIIHFAGDVTEEWLTQLTVTKRRIRYDRGQPQGYWWKPDHARDEALDCTVYALSALHGWMAQGHELDRAVEVCALRAVSPQEEVDTAPVRESPMHRQSNWLRRR